MHEALQEVAIVCRGVVHMDSGLASVAKERVGCNALRLMKLVVSRVACKA